MRHSAKTPQQPTRWNDIAILFLRLFIGAVMLLHIIGKLQTYDNEILDYPHILGFDSATSFAITTILEGLFTALIILGIATRFAALVMIVISAMVVVYGFSQGAPSPEAKLSFIYMGIYITLTISGGGYYAFNIPEMGKKLS